MQATLKYSKSMMKENVLVIIPAFNEAASIVEVVTAIKKEYPAFDLLVINDGSADETGKLAKKTKLAYVINLPYNMGIGASVQTGFKFAKKHDYQIALQFDGDGQHLIAEIKTLIKPIIEGESDCVIGSRFVQKALTYQPDSFRLLGIYILRFFSFIFVGQRIADQTSGFRAYNRKVIKFLAVHYPVDFPEPEVIILLGKNNFKMKEVFTQMRERQGGISSIPAWKGPYYIIKVLLSMTMAMLRSKKVTN
jgi:glycosyltransferase involved in cell wall biosynthesis